MPVAARHGHPSFSGDLRSYTPGGILEADATRRLDPPEGPAMCSPARCDRCGKITWAGCGQHIEQALEGVPQSERCTCA